MTLLIKDGFESGGFTKFTGTEISAGDGLTVIGGGGNHHGRKAAQATGGGDASERADCYVNVNQTVVSMRGYFKMLVALPTVNTGIAVLDMVDSLLANTIGRLSFFNLGGANINIRLDYMSGAVQLTSYVLFPYKLNEWYCLELDYKVDNAAGYALGWLGDRQIFNLTGLDTDNRGNISRLRWGIDFSATTVAHTLIFDDCIATANEGRIGTEGSPFNYVRGVGGDKRSGTNFTRNLRQSYSRWW